MPSERIVADYETITPAHSRSAAAPPRPGVMADDWPAVETTLPKSDAVTADSSSAGGTGTVLAEQESWSLRQGHLLSYLGLFMFTAVLYFRPYEYIPALSTFSSMAFWLGAATVAIFIPSQLGLEGTLTARPREVNLVLLLCLGGLLSVPLAISPGEAWGTFNDTFIKAVLMFIIMINVTRTERRLYGLLFLLMLVSFTLSLDAINDYRVGNFAVEGYRVRGAIGGMFKNPNDLALHLVTVFPIGVGLFFSTRSTVKKGLIGFCVLLFVVAIVVTFSRGGFLGLSCASAYLTWKLGRKNRLAIVLVLIVGGGGLLALSPGTYTGRLASITDFSLDPNGSANARKALLIRSLFTTLGHPLFGVGIGNFHIVSVKEQVSHNAYTQVSTEMGIPSMIVYIMFILTCLNRLRQMEKETLNATSPSRRRFYYLSIGFQAGIVGYMVHSFFASVAYNWYVYYLIGYSISLRRLYISEQTAETHRKKDGVGEQISRPQPSGLLAKA